MNQRTSISPPERDPFAVDAQPVRESPFAQAAFEQPTALEQRVAGETWDLFDREVGFDETNEYGESNLALEIIVSFGASVLHVAHLSPPRSFVIGEAGGPEPVDFHLPAEVLGRSRLPVALVEGGIVRAIVPDVAVGVIRQGKSKTSLREVMERAEPCETVTRARAQRLGAGMHVAMKLPGVEVRVGLVQKSQPIPRGLMANIDWAVPSYFGMTLGLAGALMTSLAYFVPPIGIEDEAALNQDRLLLISQYLEAASERERKIEKEASEQDSGDDEGRAGEKAQGAEGEAGKLDMERTNKRVAIKGPPDTKTATVSRLEAITLAREFGIVGLLSGASDPSAPMSVFARDPALGPDAESFNGAMFGAEIGESGGMGGLGLSGPGMGGGDLFGDGSGIGLNKWGSLGGGLGLNGGGPGQFGRSTALTGKGHQTKAPSMVGTGNTIVDGHIPPEVIRRIVRQNFGRFRMCYEQGLGRNPSLEGRIPVRFIVGSDGVVANASASGDFPDAAVKSCVVSAFYGLSFPAPERGTVKVTYPLMFSPG